MNQFCLNKDWKMHEGSLALKKEHLAEICAVKDGWYSCSLPVDVRMPLIEAGVIKEPLEADYCRESEWIEDRSWWFVKTFDGGAVCKEDDMIELVLEGLDTRSDIFLNGRYLGSNNNVHTPFVYDVKKYLCDGENTVAVRLTSGLEEVSNDDLAELNWATCLESNNGGKFRGDARRSFVRRPQYTVGWDWGPKVITCGITGNAYLRGYKAVALREVSVHTVSIGKDAVLHVMANIENLSFIGTKSADLTIEILDGDSICARHTVKHALITSGYNYFETDITIENAKLWWPNGYGEQPLYTVRVVAECEGSREAYPEFRYGIRTLALDTSEIEGEDRYFTLIVNGQRIYCKGGNWIPNDFIYARVPDEKYHVLTDEAVEANFNMLRIWGGGLYERDLFYDLCDEKGLLIWHDFMFACSTYPDHHEWFRDLMRHEFDYQTKRLRNHSSIGLFCGTNEVHWIFNSTDNPRWNIEFEYEHQYGLYVANILAKEVIRHNCGHIPYWNSSPYGGALPNDDTVGDVHRWHNALMSKKMEERIEAKDYDTIQSKFVSEYGFIGPCCQETTEQYMAGRELDRTGDVWQMHSNVFEKGTINVAIEKNYVDHAEQLSIEDYIVYGGMVHGLMYGYSLEAMRFKEYCSGGLIWMYNDAWGEVGWTIVDYYLRRKIPFYAVKRALAHRKFTMRTVDGRVVLQGLNDTPEAVTVTGEFGYASFDGSVRDTRAVSFTLAPHSREYLLTEALPEYDFSKGSMVFYADSDEIDNIWLRTRDMREMQFAPNTLKLVAEEKQGDDRMVTVCSDGYIHGVYAKGDYDCSDAYFDLLPGETKTFTVYGMKDNALSLAQVK